MTTNLHIDALAERLFRKQRLALEPEEENVLRGIHHGVPISRDAADVSDEQSTYGERLSDRVAAVGGSWGFIIAFAVVLFGWMILNTDILAHFDRAFDPYPYIFLNLMLSTLAAVQAPIILMSQNRQAAKDRVAASLDFEVNLRAELEIMRLHEKIDMTIVEKLNIILIKLDSNPSSEVKDASD
ncbi:MAG: DUF1003 domain-containing protein [Sphingomicrobium sp.]